MEQSQNKAEELSHLLGLAPVTESLHSSKHSQKSRRHLRDFAAPLPAAVVKTIGGHTRLWCV
jgi:hypothetical protein